MTSVESRFGWEDFNDLPTVDPDETPEDSWEPINLAELDEKPPVEPTLGTTGIVYPGKRHVFSGPQESAKTLAAYAIGLEVVREGGSLILIDFEMGRWDARNRLRELGATPDDFTRIHYIEPDEPATPEKIARLLELNPQLVVVDAAAGAYDIQGLDDNKRSDVERFTRLYVTKFWRNSVATIVLDHVVKNVEGRGKYAIGSERKVGGADVHLGFEVINPIKRGSTGLYKIVTHKDRGGFLKRGKLAEFELASDTASHLITWEIKPTTDDNGEPFRPTHVMEKVSRLLEPQDDPMGRNELVREAGGRGEIVRKAIDCLVSEGFFCTSQEGQKKLVQSVRAFREAFDKPPPLPPLPTASQPLPESSQLTASTASHPLQGEGGDAVAPGKAETDHPLPDDDLPF
jgi:hypothetical protein